LFNKQNIKFQERRFLFFFVEYLKASDQPLDWTRTDYNTQTGNIVTLSSSRDCNTLQHTATHCNTLQHTATHCNTLTRDIWVHAIRASEQLCSTYRLKSNWCTYTYKVTYTLRLQHAQRSVNILQIMSNWGMRLQHTTRHYNAVNHCNALYSTARHCKTLCNALDWNRLQHTDRGHSDTVLFQRLQHTATQKIGIHRNTQCPLPETATRCCVLQHTETYFRVVTQ